MLRGKIKFTGKTVIDDSILIAVSTAIICLLSPITFKLDSGTTHYLQSLTVVWFAMVLGSRIGLTSAVLYLILGGLGFNVFIEASSGWAEFIGDKGGYLLSFPIATYLVGAAGEYFVKRNYFQKLKFFISALILFSSQVVIEVLGSIRAQASIPSTPSPINSINNEMPGILVKTSIGTLLIVILIRGLSRSKS